MKHLPAALLLMLLPGCAVAQGPVERPVEALAPPGRPASAFPAPVRPVAPIVSDQWRGEDERERVTEAARVIGWLDIRPGLTVADVGAGSGYYTVRLAAAVGLGGRVLAQDVVPDYLAALRRRVGGLGNVTVGLGEAGDPRLPARSVDVAVLVHMYHEIQQPYALLGNLAAAMRPGGRVGILDVDDAVARHGTPRALLACELQAAGYRQVGFHWLLEQPPRSEYLAVFEPPDPAAPPAGEPHCVP